jgi:hypothetical protein
VGSEVLSKGVHDVKLSTVCRNGLGVVQGS